MRLIGLLISFLILTLIIVFVYQRFTPPSLETRQEINTQVQHMQDKVDSYNQQLEQHQTDLNQQLESIR